MSGSNVRLYNRWGRPAQHHQETKTLAEHYGALKDSEPHGLAPEQVEDMHTRGADVLKMALNQMDSSRRAQVLQQSKAWWDDKGGSVFSPRNARSNILETALPPGRSPDFNTRGGQLGGGSSMMMGMGGGNGSSVFTTMRPYQPEFESLRGLTPVLLSDGTHKPVKDMQVGDRVIDKTGKVQTVEKAICSGHPKEVVEIQLWGGKVFHSTDWHNWPVFAWLRTCLCGCGKNVTPGRLYVQNHYKGGDKGDDRVHVRGSTHRTGKGYQCVPKGYDPVQKLRADEIRKGDFLLMPRKFDPITTTSTEESARLLGYYVAEGSFNLGSLELTFGAHERGTWVKDSSELLSAAGLNVALTHVPSTDPDKDPTDLNEGGLQVRTGSAHQLTMWLRKHAGEGSLTKHLSEEVMRWPVKLKWELIKGMLRGDGHQQWRVSTKKGYRGCAFGVHYTTSSKALAGQTQLILAQLGFPSRIVTVPATTRVMRGKDVNCAEGYILTIPAPFAMDLADRIWGEQSEAQLYPRKVDIRPECMVDDDYIYIPVKSVKLVPNDEPVYNITVSGDHSYLVDNIGTFNSPDRQLFPIHRRIANTYWRLFNKMDPTISSVIELFSQLPWSDFQLAGEGVDGEIKEAFEYMITETKLRTLLPQIVSEFLVIGEVIPHLFFDDDKGIWSHIALHNPDQVNVVYSPFIKMDTIMEFVPDPKLRELVSSNHPMLARVRETMPPELVAHLRAGQNIPLSPINATFIARKLHPYDLRGTSVMSRLWRTLMLEDAIWSATIQTARRAATPLKVAKLGDPTSGVIPPPSEEKRVLGLLAQAENDPQAWLIYNYQIDFALAGAPERLMSINTHYELIERIKLVALGVSKSFVSGETSYSSAASGLTVFLQRLKAVRDFFVNEWLIPKFFLPVAVINGWIKPSAASKLSGGHVRIKQSAAEQADERRYIVPTIEWAKSLDPTVDKERIDAMNALENNLKIRITDQRKYASIGLDAEEEQKQLVEEYKFKKDLAGNDPQLQIFLGLAQPAEPGAGGGGGDMGMAVSPGIPPEAMGLPGGGEAGGPGGAPGDMSGGEAMPEGASISGGGGESPKPADGEAAAPELKHWSKKTIEPLVQLFESFDVEPILDQDVEPWVHAVKDPAFVAAMKHQDADELWGAIEDWTIGEGYPTDAIRELATTLTARGKLKRVGSPSLESAEKFNAVAKQLGVDVDDSSTGFDLMTGLSKVKKLL